MLVKKYLFNTCSLFLGEYEALQLCYINVHLASLDSSKAPASKHEGGRPKPSVVDEEFDAERATMGEQSTPSRTSRHFEAFHSAPSKCMIPVPSAYQKCEVTINSRNLLFYPRREENRCNAYQLMSMLSRVRHLAVTYQALRSTTRNL